MTFPLLYSYSRDGARTADLVRDSPQLVLERSASVNTNVRSNTSSRYTPVDGKRKSTEQVISTFKLGFKLKLRRFKRKNHQIFRHFLRVKIICSFTIYAEGARKSQWKNT